VKTRLLQARDLLRGRLLQRGVTLSLGALAALLVGEASAAVPAGVVQTTVQAARLFIAGQSPAGSLSATAVSLANGALKTMWLTKLKLLTILVVLLGAASLAAGALVSRPSTEAPTPVAAAPADDPQAPAPRGKDEPARTDLHGDPLPPGALARMGTTRWRL